MPCYELALLSGSDYFEEALKYVELHHLYLDSLAIWRSDSVPYLVCMGVFKARTLCLRIRSASLNCTVIGCSIVGSMIRPRLVRRYTFFPSEYHCHLSLAVYVEGGKNPKAIVAYERALMWRELFTLAAQDNMEEDAIKQIAYRVAGEKNSDSMQCKSSLFTNYFADELSSKKRFDEAARVLIDYGKDIRGCVQALAHGNSFSEARRLVRHNIYHDAGHGVDEASFAADIRAWGD